MIDDAVQSRLKELPQVGNLMEDSNLQELVTEFSHDLVKRCCIAVLEQRREAILSGGGEAPERSELIAEVRKCMEAFLQPRIKRVINATGILLHTGLGRAPLLEEVYKRAFERVRGACDLELDLESGKRGDRQDNLGDLLQFVTGAESAAVVNNNAGAVMLALNTLANRKETIVSRGQLIEIGGSFRLPEVMRKSGTRLVEVGTTNRTYLRDYQEAVGPRTRAILVAHSSNYRISGFVHEEDLNKIARFCRKHDLFLIHDLGGGVLLDLKRWNLPREPVVRESLEAGAHVVTFSGDKVLGGPQAGILVGERSALKRIRKNPLMRALRPDKFTLALLEETLKLYLSPGKLLENHPVLSRLAESSDQAIRRAEKIHQAVAAKGVSENMQLKVVASSAQLGSGALPLEEFPSAAIRLRIKGMPAAQVAMRLRLADPPVVGYIRKDGVYLDVKAIMEDDIEPLSHALSDLFYV